MATRLLLGSYSGVLGQFASVVAGITVTVYKMAPPAE